MKKKFVASFSGGKDSVYAIYQAMQAGWEPIGLLVTYDEANDRSWFHNIPPDVLAQASEALGLPLEAVKTQGDRYAGDFEEALRRWKERGATACVFGDIDIQEHYEWCDARCKNAGMESFFPLWGRRRGEVVGGFIGAGFEAVITVVNTEKMNERYVGQTLSHTLLSELAADGVDVCGENGEYHTFVVNGPIFKKRVEVTFGEKTQVGPTARIPFERT